MTSELWQPVDLGDPVIAAGVEGLRAELGKNPESIAGWKVGWNDPALRRRFGLTSGAVGALHAASTGCFASWPVGGMRLPMAEIEIAVLLRGGVGPGASDEEVLEAVEALAPAIEILDVTSFAPVEALADNLWHAGCVIGGWVPRTAATGHPLTACSTKNGRPPRPLTAASTVLVELPEILRFVADGAVKLGSELRPGHIALCGNLAPAPIPIGPDDTLTASVQPLGDVSVTFSSEAP